MPRDEKIDKKQIKLLEKIAKKVEDKAQIYADMSDDTLSKQTAIFKERLDRGETLDDLLADCFAACREAATRVLNMRHYHVQILGGIALHQGRICQMATGEGKTLVETLPAYLNALSGRGVHIVTVNDYLAKRDAEWMGKVFKFLGLSVGVVYSGQNPNEKPKQYNCDITYGTNSEFGFDYLRDNMAVEKRHKVQRVLNYVIIDEVDSILIDEARTPLIISGKSNKSSDMYITANKFARILKKDVHYTLDEKDKAVNLTDEGIARAEEFFKVENLANIENTELNHYINNALKAHAIMKRDGNYIVERGQIVIVDEFTGRKMEGRRYSGGLHQAIEAKEGVRINEENRTLATITYQNFFRLYKKMSGMTGTAKTEENEFRNIYNIDVVVIPPNLPNARIDFDDRIFKTKAGKLHNIVEEIKQRHQKGQPILVGTVTVDKSEELSLLLRKQGIRHDVLNAKNHAREAEIVAQAGRLGAVTIATNMAGRGTDILLGGNAEFMAKQELKRQNYTDEEIELATGYFQGDEKTQQLKEIYRQVLDNYKVQTDAEKLKVIEAGGLHIVGTERHDSRRIDNQLRGRAGRQGDIGSSVFFISAEDDLMRIFGGERFATILNFLRVDENQALEHKMLSRQIEGAQKRIENLHFSSRKTVLKFDDVNNLQRNAIYAERNKVLERESIHDEYLGFSSTYARKALEDACDGQEKIKLWDWDAVEGILQSRYFPMAEKVLPDQLKSAKSIKEIHQYLTEFTRKKLEEREQKAQETGEPFYAFEKYVLLRITDNRWTNHLDDLDSLKQGVGLQSVGQHDPFSVYSREAYDLFEKMMDEIHCTCVKQVLFVQYKHQPRRTVTVQQKQTKVYAEGEKPAFNDLCPCGSGEKYKHCCGRAEAQREKLERKKNKGNR